MVIGNGMIANAFNRYIDDDSVIIFASGVSNSKENRQEEFEREEALLKSIKKDVLLVYFSTCSVYDPTSQMSHYVRNKMHMERIIKYNFSKSIIFRLPNVVGRTNNPNTFFNFIKEQILSDNDIPVYFSASRHLIDIDDLSFLLPGIIEKYKNNKEIDKGEMKMDVSFNNKMMVSDIVEMMMDIMNKKNKIKIINSGCDYKIPNENFYDYLKSINYQVPENYTYRLLKKYLL